ncbi:ComEC/Rec2 family competence protein [Clostridium botulinum]|uniref:ComEC/Rec2 family competence protein n=1 Tax=Clostridium botulinum TaxID=1491 RepID=UPI0004D97611|nr:ComEC/Rec2 family competence protein [Clostridium botulinum]KEH90634.1 membrane protein [Clostridium botulinum C/D str. It1]
MKVMKVKTKFIKALILCFILMLGISSTSFAATKTFKLKTVDPQKTFSIKFNYYINSSSIKDKIIVTNNNGNIINARIDVQNNVVKVKAPEGGYMPGEYTLSIFNNIKSICNKTSKYDYIMKFNVIANKDIGNLKVHYIDVGQGDSILIQQNGSNMLIDAGTNKASNTVVNYLKAKGVNKLDYVIATHPHEDHIGGMASVINNFNVSKFIMAKVTHNSNTFKNMVNALKDKGIKITVPNVGDNYSLGTSNFTIVAPNSKQYDNLNNYSIVTKLRFGNNSFLFTGDAESLSEGEILAKQLDIQADVLKLGHHGSRTSSTEAFLDKVSPQYAIVSCGKENSYRHPHKVTMDKLQSRNIKVYRTDELGTIIATSNGKNITFNTSSGSYTSGDNKPSIEPKPQVKSEVKPKPTQGIESTVYITKSGKKFHRISCGSLRKSCISISREEAIKKGYIACNKCKP